MLRFLYKSKGRPFISGFLILLASTPLLAFEQIRQTAINSIQANSIQTQPFVFQLEMQATINAIEELLQITEHSPMSFGSFLPVVAGSITLSPEGAVTFGGEFASEPAFHEGDHSPGEMNLAGLPGQQVNLQLGSSGTTLDGPGEPMMISDIQFLDAQGNPVPEGASFRFDGDGQASLRYGATLTFSKNQEPGVYAGETQVTMNY